MNVVIISPSDFFFGTVLLGPDATARSWMDEQVSGAAEAVPVRAEAPRLVLWANLAKRLDLPVNPVATSLARYSGAIDPGDSIGGTAVLTSEGRLPAEDELRGMCEWVAATLAAAP